MRKVGDYIRDARIALRLSREKLGEKTKIKLHFIDAIEKENWEALPPFPVVTGFVKSLAHALDLDEREAVAILRRDYPIKPISITPKPDVETKFVWGPKKTFLVGVGVVVFLVAGYLGFQYRKFSSPPKLIVSEPVEGQVVKAGEIQVAGLTDVDATIKVNNQPALVTEGGEWKTDIEVDKNTNSITVEALSRSGKKTVVNRKIQVQFKLP